MNDNGVVVLFFVEGRHVRRKFGNSSSQAAIGTSSLQRQPEAIPGTRRTDDDLSETGVLSLRRPAHSRRSSSCKSAQACHNSSLASNTPANRSRRSRSSAFSSRSILTVR